MHLNVSHTGALRIDGKPWEPNGRSVLELQCLVNRLSDAHQAALLKYQSFDADRASRKSEKNCKADHRSKSKVASGETLCLCPNACAYCEQTRWWFKAWELKNQHIHARVALQQAQQENRLAGRGGIGGNEGESKASSRAGNMGETIIKIGGFGISSDAQSIYSSKSAAAGSESSDWSGRGSSDGLIPASHIHTCKPFLQRVKSTLGSLRSFS
ncbi:hypothetical protein NliqN6_2308 [Naganishia liquefaciens]|uniref:Uncharacterized protein n=1 Tax=Naganishia liquefaciens TaxID=104408 RepID=A0A8H3TR51_9TREE|nr:hypothetical protein NliqN6_2308 [Naganishia liquefaciens]